MMTYIGSLIFLFIDIIYIIVEDFFYLYYFQPAYVQEKGQKFHRIKKNILV